jgi:hypothetical protein
LTYTRPSKSAVANSGLPPSGIVSTTLPVTPSITVAFSLRPLKVKTRLVAGS